MKWNSAFTWGILALGWLAAAAKALDPPTPPESGPVVPVGFAADQTPPPSKEVSTASELKSPSQNGDRTLEFEESGPRFGIGSKPACAVDEICWDACFCQCGGWHWEAAAGLYFFQPFFDKDPAFTTSVYQGTQAYDPPGKGPATSSTTTTTTSSTSTQHTTNHVDLDIVHVPPGWLKHHWEDDFLPPGLRKWPPWVIGGTVNQQSKTTTSSSQSTTTTTTQNSTTDPKAGGSASGAGLTSRQDFTHRMEVSPLIWIGVANNDGLGFRFRWWQLWDSSGALAVNGDTTGSTEITSASPLGLSISSPSRTLDDGVGADVWLFHRELKITVWDLEATQCFDVGPWGLLLTGGIRIAHLAQNYSAVRSNGGLDPAGGMLVLQDASALWSGHNFNGAGPMASLEVRRPIADTGLVFYGNARGSILFGTRTENANTEEVFVATTANHVPVNLSIAQAATTHGDAVLPVMELELGVEYGRPVGRIYPFVRTGLVSQVWFNAGNASGTDGNFGLLGLEAALGLNF